MESDRVRKALAAVAVLMTNPVQTCLIEDDMSWKDLITPADETVTAPWTGGRNFRSVDRAFVVKGKLPTEPGWHTFSVDGSRQARWKGPATDVDVDALFDGSRLFRGYLAADRFIADDARVSFDPTQIGDVGEPVWLVEPGLDRFARVRVGRWSDGRLVYVGQEFPLGPEDEARNAYMDRKADLADVKGVTPALQFAFCFETWNRAELVRLREEAEKLVREEDARRTLAERRAQLEKQVGTGEGRRLLAAVDFEGACRAALRISGAEFLDYRDSRVAGEAVVHFRFRDRRWECVVTKSTLRIVDAGVCLIDHATGRRDDNLLTLESLPAVLSEAIDTGRLVVFRDVDQRGGYVRGEDDFHVEPHDEDDD